MLCKIKCTECSTEGTISLLETTYEGPYKCWKCRGLFAIKLKNGALLSYTKLSQEEFEKLQEIDALRKKFRKD